MQKDLLELSPVCVGLERQNPGHNLQLAMPRSALYVVLTMRAGLQGSSERDFYRCILVLSCDAFSSLETLERQD